MMRNKHARALLLLVAFMAGCRATPAPPPAASKRALLVFGDSMSDTGNFALLTNRTVPPARLGYWQGRFTNSPGNWIDHLNRNTRNTFVVHNYAYGGATACAYGASPIPSLGQQVAMYHAKVANSSTYRYQINRYPRIAVIMTGANDLIQAQGRIDPANMTAAYAFLTNVTQCIAGAAQQLLSAREQTVIVSNLPPLELTPEIQANPANVPLVRAAMMALNAGLGQAVQALAAAFPTKKVLLWDLYSSVVGSITDYHSAGFRYNSSCIVYPVGRGVLVGATPLSRCNWPNTHLWFDMVHPSSPAMNYIARSMQTLLGQHNMTAPA